MKRERLDIVRRVAFLLLAAAMIGSAACGDSSGPRNNPSGTYSLRQVDQTAIPVDIQHGPWYDIASNHFYNLLIISVVGGEAVLDTGRFSLRFDLVVNSDGQVGRPSLQLEGDYEIVGNQIVFDPDGNANLSAGTLQKGAITIGVDLMAKGSDNHYTFRR